MLDLLVIKMRQSEQHNRGLKLPWSTFQDEGQIHVGVYFRIIMIEMVDMWVPQIFQYFVSLPMESNGALPICFQTDVLQISCISCVASNLSHFVSSFIICTSRQNQRVLANLKYFQFSCQAFENLVMIEHLIKIASELLITGLGLFTISEFM